MATQQDNLMLFDVTSFKRRLIDPTDDILLSIIFASDNFKRGAVDPNAGAGTAGNEGDFYQRTQVGAGSLYINTDGTNFGWAQLGAGGGGGTLQDAYSNGNTATTTLANGNFEVDGDQGFSVNMSSGGFFNIFGSALSTVGTTSGDLNIQTQDVASGILSISSAQSIAISGGNNATGPGFAITIDSGDATAGNFNGGTTSFKVGNGFGTGDGGDFTVAAGVSGVSGGAGGNVELFAGSGGGGFGSGGSIILSSGAATGGGNEGVVLIDSIRSESVPLLRFNNASGSADIYTGGNDPSGIVFALAGSLFLRDSGTTGELYLNTSLGSGATWTQLGAGGGGSDLQSAYGVGNFIITNSTDGPFDISGTEPITLAGDGGANTWNANNSNLQLTTSGDNADIFIQCTGQPTAPGPSNGNDVTIDAGQARGDGGDGGRVTIGGGDSDVGVATGNGGSVQLLGGDAQSTNGDGGTINLQPGAATGTGQPGVVVVLPDVAGAWPSMVYNDVGTGEVVTYGHGVLSPQGYSIGVMGSLYSQTDNAAARPKGQLWINQTLGGSFGTTWGRFDAKEYVEVTTTDATPTAAWTYTIPDYHSVDIEVDTMCQALPLNAARGRFTTIGIFGRLATGAFQTGSISQLATRRSNASLDTTIVTSGNDVQIQVTGLAATTINWRLIIRWEVMDGT